MAGLILCAAAEKTLVTCALQAASGAVKGPLSGVYLGLIKEDFVASPDRVIGDLTEADYTDYARQLVAWGDPFMEADKTWIALAAASYLFQIGALDPAKTFYGYALYSASTAGTLIAMEKFVGPIELLNSNRGLSITPVFDAGRSSDWGLALLAY